LALGACTHALAEPWPEEPAAGSFYLVMDKSKNELTVRSLLQAGKVYRTLRAISGTNLGDKVREGDLKTPEGIYFIERRIPQGRLTAEHGPAAFELNYPNAVDRIYKRTGGGIWIHGVDSEKRLEKRFDTRGCVAVSNSDILDLGSRLKARNTPIVIVDSEVAAAGAVGVQAADGPLAQRVHEWAKSWSSKSVEEYLKFYSPDFFARGMNFEQWKKYKGRLAKNYSYIEVTLRDMKILQHGKYAVAIFDQTYKSDRFQARGLKRLYLVGSGPEAQILAEEIAEERQGMAGSFSLEDPELVRKLSLGPLSGAEEAAPN
jgi:murein L,D-transpeptidase YafK